MSIVVCISMAMSSAFVTFRHKHACRYFVLSARTLINIDSRFWQTSDASFTAMFNSQTTQSVPILTFLSSELRPVLGSSRKNKVLRF